MSLAGVLLAVVVFGGFGYLAYFVWSRYGLFDLVVSLFVCLSLFGVFRYFVWARGESLG